MTARLPSLNGLRAFEAAARHLSFTQAASELNVTQTAISHQIRRLEEELGIRLFVRQNRALALTPEARDYLPRRPRRVQRPPARHRPAAAQGRRQGADRLHAGLAGRQMAAAAAVRIPGSPSRHRRPHHHLDRLVDFKRGDVDAAIRYGRGHWPGVRADWLMADELFPVCSPALLQGNKPLRCPEDLAHHMLLHTSGAYDDDWRLWLTAAGLPADISKQPGLTFDLIFMTIQAAIDGYRRRDRPHLLCRRTTSPRAAWWFPSRSRCRPMPASTWCRRRAAPKRPSSRAFRQWLIASAQDKA